MIHVEAKGEGELHDNGIRLPETWPPRVQNLPDDAITPPYLASPPKVIRIDVGRQLFVDDSLIEHTNMQRPFHAAEYSPNNPALKPDRLWERAGRGPMAMPFSSGVWYDPSDHLFKMWYMGSYNIYLCYATSWKQMLHARLLFR